MSFKDVMDRFALVSGLEQEEISKWVFVILDCIKYFESKKGNRILTQNEEKRLCNACADNSSKFKAGDIEITKAENLSDKAHAMWQQTKEEISDIVDFDNFSFARVGA